MNNSTDLCGLPETLVHVKDRMYFAVFYVFTPIYFVVAFVGHVLLIVGFAKRARKDAAYTYQIYFAISKTLEIFFFTLFVIACKLLSGMELGSYIGFQRNRPLMAFAAHAGVPIQNSCITTSLLLAVAMAADRVFALWKPFRYKSIDHRKHCLVAVTICVLLGWMSSIFDWLRFELVFNGDYYSIRVDKVYVGGLVAQTLANVRNAMRMLGVVSLIVCNVLIVILYHRKALIHKAPDHGAAVSIAEEKRINERKASERALIIIVLVQSICITVSLGMFVAFYVIVYAVPSFSLCASGVLFASVMDGLLELGDVISFISIAAVDKKVRQTIMAAIRCRKNNQVAQTTTSAVRDSAVNVVISQMPSVAE